MKSSQLTDVNSTKYSNLQRYIVGYGLPLVIMSIYLLVSKMKDENDDPVDEEIETKAMQHDETEESDHQYCWLTQEYFIYFFVAPLAVILIINSFVFFLAVSVANKKRKSLNASKSVKIFNQIKTWAILTFLLGQTWLAGFLIQKHIQGFTYVFVGLNGSSGIFLFIHTILMNDVIMLELKIKFGFADQVELALNNSGSRITASKSFRKEEKPKVKKRPARQKTESTSSDELPQLPRPQRKPYKQHLRHKATNAGGLDKNRQKILFAKDNLYATSPENTSLSSANSLNPSSYEQTSSESLHQKRLHALELRSRRSKQQLVDQLEETVKHNRLAELQKQSEKGLQRHHSNKW